MTDPTRDHPAWPPIQRQFLGMVFAAPFYGLTLLRRQPAGLLAAIPDPWPGNAKRGAAMVGGSFAFAGKIKRPDDSPWDEADADDGWLDAQHSFVWVRDLRALGGDDALRGGDWWGGVRLHGVHGLPPRKELGASEVGAGHAVLGNRLPSALRHGLISA